MILRSHSNNAMVTSVICRALTVSLAAYSMVIMAILILIVIFAFTAPILKKRAA